MKQLVDMKNFRACAITIASLSVFYLGLKIAVSVADPQSSLWLPPVGKPNSKISPQQLKKAAEVFDSMDRATDPNFTGSSDPNDIQVISSTPPSLKYSSSAAIDSSIHIPSAIFSDLIYASAKSDNASVNPEIIKLSDAKTYNFSPDSKNNSYIFDPIITRDGGKFIFKYGRNEVDLDSSGLYSFNKKDLKVTQISSTYLRSPQVSVSPDGKYVAYFEGEAGLELWVTDLTNEKRILVAKGNSVASPVWLSGKLLYSIQKKHLVNGKAVMQPVTFSFDMETLKREVVVDLSNVFSVSPDQKYLVYQGPKNPSEIYSETNYSLKIRDLRSSEDISDIPQYSSDGQFNVSWLSDSSQLVIAKTNNFVKGDVENKKVNVFNSNHTIYTYDLKEKEMLKVSEIKTHGIQSFTNVDIVNAMKGGNLTICLSSYTDIEDSKLSGKNYDIKQMDTTSGTWKNLTILKGVLGLSVVKMDGHVVSVRY